MLNVSQNELIPHSNSIKPNTFESFRSLFYLLLPSESQYKDVSQVPNYTAAASSAFFTLIFVELFVALAKGKRTFRINDGLSSIHAGINSRLIRVLTTRSIELSMYIWVYENWRLVDLPWDSSAIWFLSFLGVDFAYYWFHRAAHEINIMWASHQTHHSSEDYNLTTALRQSAFQGYFSMFFHLPAALLIPPSVHLVHLQVNILVQFWIHTELIDSLGPLEYILNTPSHHRVHHGRNPYCIDKNYAGLLIIWDRMFGTFAAERKDEKVAYGLVSPINSFDPVYIQIGYYKHLFTRAWETKGFTNKISVFIKGPGWSPGKPRLGEFKDLPAVEYPITRYGSCLPNWLSAYTFLHSLMVTAIYDKLMGLRLQLAGNLIIFDVIFIICALTCIGMLFDEKSYAYHAECLRCFVFAFLLRAYKARIGETHRLPMMMMNFVESAYFFSAFLWIILIFRSRKIKNA